MQVCQLSGMTCRPAAAPGRGELDLPPALKLTRPVTGRSRPGEGAPRSKARRVRVLSDVNEQVRRLASLV